MVAVFTFAAFVVVAAAPSGMLGSASADCQGAGSPERFNRHWNGHLAAVEDAVDGACNQDGTYRGTIADVAADGKCAIVKFRDAGIISTQGIDCSANDGPVHYVFNDRNGDHRAEIKVCVEGQCPNLKWNRDIWGY